MPRFSIFLAPGPTRSASRIRPFLPFRRFRRPRRPRRPWSDRMQLKTEQMVELLIALGTPVRPTAPAPWGGNGRRWAPRVGIGSPTRLRLLAGTTGRTADPEPAILRDISSRGVGIAFHRE